MAALEWIRFIAGAAFLLAGLFLFAVEIIGVFRYKYALNRMHAAAIGDTLAIGLALIGLIIINGINFTSFKMFLVIVFLWLSSPTCSHLLARLEVETNEEEGYYETISLKELEEREEEVK